jgi:hypothetical protein
MARKRHTAEEIVTKRRQVDVLVSQGRPIVTSSTLIQLGEKWERRISIGEDSFVYRRPVNRES